MEFIDRFWQKGHVLSAHQGLMDWQHRAHDGKYNFLLALDGNALVGILGYIPTRQFDPELKSDNVLWLVQWKVIDDAQYGGLGLRMLSTLSQMEHYTAIGTNGNNKLVRAIYKALGYKVGELRQYIVTNPDLPQRLIESPNGAVLPSPRGGGVELEEMDSDQLMGLPLQYRRSGHIPRKTPRYFVNRFLQHPVYRYRVFIAQEGSGRTALIATRIAEHDGHRVLRLVEFAGKASVLASCGNAIATLMREEGAEYADFWQMGILEDYLTAAGFSAVDPDGRIVVPNYFEPFLASNGRILFAIRMVSLDGVIICRADGDQDRPNVIAS